MARSVRRSFCVYADAAGESHGLILFDDHVMIDFNQPIFLMNPYESHILIDFHILLPSGKRLQFAMERSTMLLMGKLTISMAMASMIIPPWDSDWIQLMTGGFRFVIGLPPVMMTSSIYRWDFRWDFP